MAKSEEKCYFCIVMKIIVAPDSYKECLPAKQVAQTISRAIECPGAEIIEIPLADGGEGTLDVLAGTFKAEMREAIVHDPLGRPIKASFGVAGDTAIIEVAQACGLGLLEPAERNPIKASSYGVGELLMAAVDCDNFIIGLGGSAICDGGVGMLSVPGVKQLLAKSHVELLCDVYAPFVGASGAARVFAPQKGASPDDVEVLESRMIATANAYYAETGLDVSFIPGSGAAGGLAGAFLAFSSARISKGIERILELTGFDIAARDSDFIITGEGKSDAQTLLGKVPYGVLQHSRDVKVILVSGRIDNSSELLASGFAQLIEVTPRTMPLPQALNPETAKSLLESAIKNHFLGPKS